MEKNLDINSEGNDYTTQFRQYDARVARWKSLDPLMAKYANQSPYATFNNNPIFFSDPTGLEGEEKPLNKSEKKFKKEVVDILKVELDKILKEPGAEKYTEAEINKKLKPTIDGLNEEHKGEKWFNHGLEQRDLMTNANGWKTDTDSKIRDDIFNGIYNQTYKSSDWDSRVSTKVLAGTQTQDGLELDFNKIKLKSSVVKITEEGFNLGRTTITVAPGMNADEVTVYTKDENGEKIVLKNETASAYGEATIIITNSSMINRKIYIAVKQANDENYVSGNQSDAKINVNVSTFGIKTDSPIINHSNKHAQKR